MIVSTKLENTELLISEIESLEGCQLDRPILKVLRTLYAMKTNLIETALNGANNEVISDIKDADYKLGTQIEPALTPDEIRQDGYSIILDKTRDQKLNLAKLNFEKIHAELISALIATPCLGD